MHTRRESKMSAQGNTCTELIADALSLSNGIYQHAKQKTGFTLPLKKKKERPYSVHNEEPKRFLWNWMRMRGWCFQTKFPSSLSLNETTAISAEDEPSFYTNWKKQWGNKSCLFLTNPSSHNRYSGATQIRDPLLSALPWKSWFLSCPSHLCGLKFFSFFIQK